MAAKTLGGKNQSSWESFPHIHAIPSAVSLAPICHFLHLLPFMLPTKIQKWGCTTQADKTKEVKTLCELGRGHDEMVVLLVLGGDGYYWQRWMEGMKCSETRHKRKRAEEKKGSRCKRNTRKQWCRCERKKRGFSGTMCFHCSNQNTGNCVGVLKPLKKIRSSLSQIFPPSLWSRGLQNGVCTIQSIGVHEGDIFLPASNNGTTTPSPPSTASDTMTIARHRPAEGTRRPPAAAGSAPLGSARFGSAPPNEHTAHTVSVHQEVKGF